MKKKPGVPIISFFLPQSYHQYTHWINITNVPQKFQYVMEPLCTANNYYYFVERRLYNTMHVRCPLCMLNLHLTVEPMGGTERLLFFCQTIFTSPLIAWKSTTTKTKKFLLWTDLTELIILLRWTLHFVTQLTVKGLSLMCRRLDTDSNLFGWFLMRPYGFTHLMTVQSSKWKFNRRCDFYPIILKKIQSCE